MPFIMRLLSLLVCLFAATAWAEETTPPASADVRILIDVSGSMKKTDPLNLRIPALKLLVSLLPADAQASLWLFAEEPHTLLALGKTDKTWKSRALASAGKITSSGLFTDIEAALNKATEDWMKATALAGKRHVILLTDGMVDISKDAQKNAESRQRVISESIPKLQQLGVQVHTIALSDQADMELLKQLSQDTSGWHESIEAAEQLERMFAKVVTKTTPHDTVPLQGNKFTVDPSIQEFSLLVFLDTGAEPTRLIRPDQLEISEIMLQPNVHWRHEKGYDLITVSQPTPGEWQLVAKTDPDNQVMVITDLKMAVKDLPNYLTKGEALNLSAHFTDKEGDITKEEFLKLISVRAKHNNTDEQALAPDTAKPGYFAASFKNLAPGKHTLLITADGSTFKREATHNLEVVEQLVGAGFTVDSAANPPQLLVGLTPNKDILDSKSLRIMAKLSNAYGQNTEVQVPEHDGQWTLRLPLPSPQELLTINFSVTAKTLQGKDIKPSVPPLVLNSQNLADLSAKIPAPKTTEPAAKPETEAKVETETEPKPAEPEETPAEGMGPNWMLTTIAAIVINLVLIGGGWYGYRAYKKRASAKQSALLGDLMPPDPTKDLTSV